MKKILLCTTLLFLLLLCFGFISTYAASYGDLTYKEKSNGIIITSCNKEVIEVEIPNEINGKSVIAIGQYAFDGCTELTSIEIPDSVVEIEEFAFNGCNSLTSVSLGKNVTHIGACAFANCDGLISVVIPNSVTTIGSNAFSLCGGLESVTIPSSVTVVGDFAFSSCFSLKNVYITSLEAWCNIDFLGPEANPMQNAKYLYLNNQLVEDLIIPESLTQIKPYTFCGCKSITNIIIPDSVTIIGKEAFRSCEGLKRVSIPNSVTKISSSAFYYCKNLRYICLPISLLYVQAGAFDLCSSIEIVFYEGNRVQWDNVLIYSNNEDVTNAIIAFDITKKEYSLETNCNQSIPNVVDYAVFDKPTINIEGKILQGWYDNEELNGNPVTFPYYGDATTLYAAWIDRTGKSFDDAFIAKANQEYTVSTTESGQLTYFEFVPKFSKEYRFYTTGSKDTYGYFYNSSKTQIASNNNAGEGNNFYISYNLTAGQTYYIAAKLYSGTGTFTFVVEEPVDYRINEITIKDMSGNNLQTIPTGHFLATVSFTNVSSSADTVIILAQYTNAGAFNGLMYVQTEDVPTGSTIKLSIPVDNSKGDVARLKAFCWESFGSLTPMGNSASFPVE